jgi:hypothetical protein
MEGRAPTASTHAPVVEDLSLDGRAKRAEVHPLDGYQFSRVSMLCQAHLAKGPRPKHPLYLVSRAFHAVGCALSVA